MPYDWGTSHNGVKLGVFYDGVEISADGSQGRITNARIKIDRSVNIADSSNNLSWSGGAVTDGSDANINVDGSGEKTIKSCSETWCDLSYTGVTHHDFNASMSGINYAGSTISAGISCAYPQRLYSLPAAPTGVYFSGSLGNFTVYWTNNSTADAPWTVANLYRYDYATGLATVISVPSPTTSGAMAQTVDATGRYYWILAVGNSAGNVSSAATAVTPAPLHTLTMDYSSRLIGQDLNLAINKNGSSYQSVIYIDGLLIQNKTLATGVLYNFGQATWASRLSNVITKSLAVILETWTADGVSLIGSNTYYVTLNLPTPLGVYAPTATAPTVTDQTTEVTTAFGAGTYIQNMSVLRVTHNGAAGVGATITKKEVIVNGATYDVTATGYKDIPVTWITSPTAQSRTTDTRMTSDPSSTVVVKGYPYSKPVIVTFMAQRCDSAGNPTGSGTQVKFTVDVAATSIINSGEKNTMKFDVYLAVNGVQSGPALFSKAANSTVVTSPASVSGVIGALNTYSKSASYSFILIVNDDLAASTVSKLASIPTEVVPLSIGPNGVAIGKVYDDTTKALDVLGDVRVVGNINASGMVGIIQMFGGATPPTGALVCDGSVYDPILYPILYSVIGILYGGTAGAPLLPNLAGRAPLGVWAGDTRTNALGKMGGEFDHALTTAELASHAHTIAHTHTGTTAGEAAHTHGPGTLTGGIMMRNSDDSGSTIWGALAYNFSAYDLSGTGTTNRPGTPAVQITGGATGAGSSHAHTFTTDGSSAANSGNAGSGTAHNNMQPFTIVNFIIWAK
jgi:microcystin-dependent protein